MRFVIESHAKPANLAGTIVPVHLTVYEDRSFTFVTRTPPASDMLRKAAGVEKGSSEFRAGSVGKISKQQLKEIAESKLADLNAGGVDEAMAIIAGTARSMGIDVGE